MKLFLSLIFNLILFLDLHAYQLNLSVFQNKKINMKNVIIYSRVSTDEQAQQGYSLEYQEEVITRYSLHKGYNIIKKLY